MTRANRSASSASCGLSQSQQNPCFLSLTGPMGYAKLTPHNLRPDRSLVSCWTSTCALQCRLEAPSGPKARCEQPLARSCMRPGADPWVTNQGSQRTGSSAGCLELPTFLDAPWKRSMHDLCTTPELRQRQEGVQEVTSLPASWADKTPSSSPELSAVTILMASSARLGMSTMLTRHMTECLPRVQVDPPPSTLDHMLGTSTHPAGASRRYRIMCIQILKGGRKVGQKKGRICCSISTITSLPSGLATARPTLLRETLWQSALEGVVWGTSQPG